MVSSRTLEPAEATQLARASEVQSKQIGLATESLADYTDWVFRAGFLHLSDPAGAWRALHEQQERVARYLSGKDTLRFQAPPSDDAPPPVFGTPPKQ